MGVAALVIGIIAIICGFIPLCGYFALLPAVVGLILGIISASKAAKNNQPKSVALAGAILNGIAIIFIVVWTAIFISNAKEAKIQFDKEMQKNMPVELKKQMKEIDKNMSEKMKKDMKEMQDKAEKDVKKMQKDMEKK